MSSNQEPRITFNMDDALAKASEVPPAESDGHLSPPEIAQLHQTIEMFEVITQSQPDDYESLALLKEAYQQLGKRDEILRVGRQLGDSFVRAGQIPSAIREYEEILQRNPDDTQIPEILEDLVGKMRGGARDGRIKASTADGTVIDIPWGDLPEIGANLIPTNQTRVESDHERRRILQTDDGLEALARFLTSQNISLKPAITDAVDEVRKFNKNLEGQTLAVSLIEVLARKLSEEQIEGMIVSLLEHTRYPFAPLEYYEVDRQIVRILPQDITLGRTIVPFDMVSRTLMIALSNPFDAAVKRAVQESVDQEVLWYFARPAAISKVLADAYRLNARIQS